jgi:hypothetical protein
MTPVKRKSQWTVGLPLPEADRDFEGAGEKDEIPLPRRAPKVVTLSPTITFTHYLKNIFQTWDEWDFQPGGDVTQHDVASIDIWLQVLITFLCTRDVILLSHTCKHLHTIAEDVRQKRQDIHRLLSNFIDDVDGFRRLMKKMGGINIVGDMTSVFFTGATLGEVSSLDLVLYNVDLESCASSWFSLLRGETITVGTNISTRFRIREFHMVSAFISLISFLISLC